MLQFLDVSFQFFGFVSELFCRLMLSGVELEAYCFYWPVCSSDFADTIAVNWNGRLFVKVVIAKQFEMHS